MQNFLKKPDEIKNLTKTQGGCLASNQITVDGEKVGYAYREAPDANFPGDSGWRFLSGKEDEQYLKQPEHLHTFELNTICNYDERIVPLLTSPIGTILVDQDGVLVIENF